MATHLTQDPVLYSVGAEQENVTTGTFTIIQRYVNPDGSPAYDVTIRIPGVKLADYDDVTFPTAVVVPALTAELALWGFTWP
jgi:hypothetical protein